MADQKISQLTAATALSGTEVVPVVQGGSTKKATVDQILAPAAGKGIDFSANAGTPGMTSELLDWYEEGVWTPAGGTVGATSSSGTYTRIGQQVTVQAEFFGSISFGAGAVICDNLPFSVLANNNFAGVVTDAASTQGAFVRANSTYIISCSALTVPVARLTLTATYFV